MGREGKYIILLFKFIIQLRREHIILIGTVKQLHNKKETILYIVDK